MKKDYTFNTSDDQILRATVYGYENLGSGRIIVYVHGFKGFKDWGFVPYLGGYLAENGYCVFTFNFSHNGIGENLLEFTEMEKFELNTYSREIDELKELTSAIKDGYFGETGNTEISFIGHSRGGGVALLAASEMPAVSAVVLWASIARVDRYSVRQKEQWRNTGALEVRNARTGQLMRLGTGLLEDVEKHAQRLNIKNAAKRLNRPLLIIHGEQDVAVPVREADEIFRMARKELTEIHKLAAAGHTFDITHPFAGSNPKFDEVLEKTLGFLQHLDRSRDIVGEKG